MVALGVFLSVKINHKIFTKCCHFLAEKTVAICRVRQKMSTLVKILWNFMVYYTDETVPKLSSNN